MATRFNVVTNSYAANLNSIRATSLRTSMNAAKIKIYDLNSLREKHTQTSITRNEYELILGVPPSGQTDVPEEAQEKISQYKQGLIDTANSMEIGVFAVDSIDKAVNHVAKKVAA